MKQKIDQAKTWISNNKLLTLTLLALFYFVVWPQISWRMYSNTLSGARYDMAYEMGVSSDGFGISPSAPTSRIGIFPPYQPDSYEQVPQEDRRVATTSYFSILVKSITESTNAIQTKAEELDGYLINKNLRTPGEWETGSITIRIPTEKRDEMVGFLRNTGIRVVDETVSAQDVTDQYVDVDRRLQILNDTKTKFEIIFERAESIEDILRVQRELTTLQNQIDSLVGQQRMLQATTETSLISVSLSTDELALPYAPENAWRPEAIFKLAVRSLMGTLYGLGNSAIWIAVYSVLWVPALAIAYVVYKKWLR